MARNTSVTELDPPELTDEQLARLRPTRDVLSPEHYAAVTGRGRPRSADPKVSVTIRLDADVVAAFKATGKGWQTRINETLSRSAVSRRFVAAEPAVRSTNSPSLKKTVKKGSV